MTDGSHKGCRYISGEYVSVAAALVAATQGQHTGLIVKVCKSVMQALVYADNRVI